MSAARIAVGVDGCKGGWFAVKRHINSGAIVTGVFATFDALLLWAPAPALIGIDMPIGLAADGARDCDVQARKRLGWPRAASVFSAPVRTVLGARSYDEACARNRAATGRAMSKQSFNILAKIDEVDAALRPFTAAPPRVFEVHPELAFMGLAQQAVSTPSLRLAVQDGLASGDRPQQGLTEPKRTPAGHARRLALLPEAYRPAIDHALAHRRRAECAADDVLDAFAVLWSAERCLSAEAIAISTRNEIDSVGLEMNIRY